MNSPNNTCLHEFIRIFIYVVFLLFDTRCIALLEPRIASYLETAGIIVLFCSDIYTWQWKLANMYI